MFAVVDVAGQQVKVGPNEKICVPKLPQEVGSEVKLDHVLLVADGTSVRIGNPYVSNSSVAAKVLRHLKDDKVIVFKKKRRKGYRVRRGHRQQMTEIEITAIA